MVYCFMFLNKMMCFILYFCYLCQMIGLWKRLKHVLQIKTLLPKISCDWWSIVLCSSTKWYVSFQEHSTCITYWNPSTVKWWNLCLCLWYAVSLPWWHLSQLQLFGNTTLDILSAECPGRRSFIYLKCFPLGFNCYTFILVKGSPGNSLICSWTILANI